MANGISGKMRIPTTADLMSMWNASGLKEKLIFTFLMILLFRLGIHLPIYGINETVFANVINSSNGNNILGFLDLFSGGALGKVSIFALGIGPYITSSIIMQLMAVIIPALEKLQKEDGEAGRRKLSQYTRIFTVILAAFQSIVFMAYMSHLPGAILPFSFRKVALTFQLETTVSGFWGEANIFSLRTPLPRRPLTLTLVASSIPLR